MSKTYKVAVIAGDGIGKEVIPAGIAALEAATTGTGVSLFIPIVAGLYVRRTSSAGALASMIAGVSGSLALHLFTGGRGWGVVTPAIAGLAAAGVAWVVTLTAAKPT